MKRKVKIGYSIDPSTQLLFRDITIDFLITDEESLKKVQHALYDDTKERLIKEGRADDIGQIYAAESFVINIWSFYETKGTPTSLQTIYSAVDTKVEALPGSLKRTFAPFEQRCGGQGPQ